MYVRRATHTYIKHPVLHPLHGRTALVYPVEDSVLAKQIIYAVTCISNSYTPLLKSCTGFHTGFFFFGSGTGGGGGDKQNKGGGDSC